MNNEEHLPRDHFFRQYCHPSITNGASSPRPWDSSGIVAIIVPIMENMRLAQNN